MIRKEFILSELKYRYPENKGIHSPSPRDGRTAVVPGRWPTRGLARAIIICTASELDQMSNIDPSPALFLCIGTPGQQVTGTLDLCVLTTDEGKSALFNFVQRLFDRLDEWRQRLKELSETAEDVSVLLGGGTNAAKPSLALRRKAARCFPRGALF
jgi:hypothetical protein